MTSRIKLSGLISPGLYDVHRAVRSGTVDEIVLAGGRGSTKSSCASIELILLLLQHPDCHAAVLRKVGRTLRTSVYEQIAWAVSALDLTSRFELTVSPMRAVYKPTGQRIMFLGLDDPGKLKSIKVPFGYIAVTHFEEKDQFAGRADVSPLHFVLLAMALLAVIVCIVVARAWRIANENPVDSIKSE